MRLLLVVLVSVFLLLVAVPALAHHRCGHKDAPCSTPTPTPTPTATPTPSPTPTPTPSGTVLVDEFNGLAGQAPNTNLWSMYPWSAPNTTQVPGAARLDGLGNLELVTRNMSEAAGLWTKGKVEIKPPFTATATVKWPNSVEIWHGFWWDGSSWPIHGELDFYETGNVAYFEPHWYQGCAHEWNGSTRVSKRCQRIVPGFDPRAAYHRYGARVTSTSITYLLDGVPVGVSYPLTSAWQQAGHFIFTMWPNHAGYTAPTGFPATMKVARVEVTVP